jgi:hypothetical protein
MVKIARSPLVKNPVAHIAEIHSSSNFDQMQRASHKIHQMFELPSM